MFAGCLSNKHETLYWTNGGLILGHRLRRWPNIKPQLAQRLVFANTSRWPDSGLVLATSD